MATKAQLQEQVEALSERVEELEANAGPAPGGTTVQKARAHYESALEHVLAANALLGQSYPVDVDSIAHKMRTTVLQANQCSDGEAA